MTSNSTKAHFKIIIDGDSCPVREIIFRVAYEKLIPVLVVASVSHIMAAAPGDVTFVSVDNIPQAADIAIINRVVRGDIVVTGDYGLASVILSKGATPVSPRGYRFTHENIDNLLLKRHVEAKIRRSGGKTKGPKAFTQQDRQTFEETLKKLITDKQISL